MTTRNRVKYAACSVSNFNTSDGHITAREFARMEVVASTGAGIITNQGAYPDSKGEGKAYIKQLAICDDKYIPGFAKITDMIHKHNAIAIQQLLHGGRYGGIELPYCKQASDVPQTLKHFRPPRTMTKDEIRQCIEDHATAAGRAIKAGFDGVEITAFMGYLLANFLSGFTNKRTDEYGGSFENRGRFLREIIGKIKDRIKDAPLIVRLNGEELMDDYGGNSPDECIQFMKMAEEAGADCISVVVGWHESRRGALGRDVPTDHWLPIARRAKAKLKIPIAFGPRFGSPVMAEKALGEGIVDFWEVCRPFLADTELLHKVAQDRLDEVKPCVGDLVCLARMFRNLPYICTVNARLGHEYEPEYEIRPAVSAKNILVVGAGPAGLEFAITTKKRGHNVTVLERESEIGGQLQYAIREQEGGSVYKDLIRHYDVTAKKLAVEIRLSTEATVRMIEKMRPDVVVIAAGAGLSEDTPFQHDGVKPLSAFDVLAGTAKVSGRVLVVGGERLGLVTAEWLAMNGSKVTLLEQGERLAEDVAPTFKWRHLAWLKDYKIEWFSGAKILDVKEGVLKYSRKGEATTIEFDTLIHAGPRQSRNQLFKELNFLVDELYMIGDAVEPRSLPNAIHDAYRLATRV